MNLNDKAALILASVELDADLPLAEIAQRTALKEHTIRYQLKTLEDNGTILRRPLIDIAKLGYQFIGVFFSLPTQDKDQTLKRLLNDRRIVWLAEIGGPFQYGMAFACHNLSELEIFLSKLAVDTHEVFIDKSIAMQFAVQRFPRRYLAPALNIQKSFSIRSSKEAETIDGLDERILSNLAFERPRSRRMLAKNIGEPLSTIDQRVKRLEDKKIILGYYYEIDPQRIGMQSYTLLVYAKGLDKNFEEQLMQYADEHPAIYEVYTCLGSWDYELNLDVHQAREVTGIVDQLSKHFPKSISKIQTLNKFKDLKYNLVPF